ncbi:uncharacterized protein LOC115886109 [Sitophilus oryzae]|uniref:Uncharacterized protein LOC115886109 n=1 Tax=Sitophilus oryzae TaxID=7048 RepID=A0A6J2YAY5_SITOR|nr:uncharacterized protein LOC115886109 [Sitophilus oryzae]
MEHLAQDLTVALQESESCGPIVTQPSGKWGMRRRTRSAGNLHHLFVNKSADNNSEESSSSPSELKFDKHRTKLASFHQSDSDDLSLSVAVAKILSQKNSLRMKHSIHGLFRGVSHSLESDSVNEYSPASRPSLRRKRKLKRMSIDETPIPPTGKRKRSQRMEMMDNARSLKHTIKIKPLHQNVVDKIEKFCQSPPILDEETRMETQDENWEVASESSISWSGGEGHEGDDELTDWAPSIDNSSTMDQTSWSEDPREIRAGCRRLRDERPGFSISTGANERVAKFLQDSTKFELKIFGAEHEKLGQLAALYSLDLWYESPTTTLLRKTTKTPYMQPPQRHHSGHSAIHKKIRTHKNSIS